MGHGPMIKSSWLRNHSEASIYIGHVSGEFGIVPNMSFQCIPHSRIIPGLWDLLSAPDMTKHAPCSLLPPCSYVLPCIVT